MLEFAWDIKTSFIVSCENCNMFTFVLSSVKKAPPCTTTTAEEILEVNEVFEERHGHFLFHPADRNA